MRMNSALIYMATLVGFSFLLSLPMSLFLPSHVAAQSPASIKPAGSVTSSRAKLEDLVIWKFSDELKLSALEEKKFSDFFRDLSKKKSILEKANFEIIERLRKSKSNSETEKILVDYKRNAISSEHLAVEEIERVTKSLGSEKARQYLVLKFDLNKKLRDMGSPSTPESGSKKLPPPKIIEE